MVIVKKMKMCGVVSSVARRQVNKFGPRVIYVITVATNIAKEPENELYVMGFTFASSCIPQCLRLN